MTEPNQSASGTAATGLSDNAVAAISYITFVPAIAFLILEPYKRSSYVRFHAWQCIFLSLGAFFISFVLGIGLSMMSFFSFFVARTIGELVDLCWFLLWILCVVNAINGKRFKLPIVGQLAERQAGS
jgi:uncharacterized membrane protein